MIEESGLSFQINKDNCTAKVIGSIHAIKDILIPHSVADQANKYIVTVIKEGSFKNNANIKSVTIPENSCLLTIEQGSFSHSSIHTLFIPASIKEFKEGWCKQTKSLNNIIISPKNKHFKYLDEKHQVIVRKSDPNKEIYDSIVFASRDITTITIPKTIKYIESYSFENCEQLEEIIFHKDSQLQTIGENAFSNTSIRSLFIPSNVKEIKDGWIKNTSKLKNISISPQNKYVKFIEKMIVIKSDPCKENYDKIIFADKSIECATIPKTIRYIGSYSFCNHKDLKKVSISEDSELQKIGKNAFSGANITDLFIPQNVKELQNGWCKGTKCLKKIMISPKNKHFKYLDEKQSIIVRKSDPNKENFDTIAFANRYIECVTIPKAIKYIDLYAFENCSYLTNLFIPEDSKLQIIGKYAFQSTSFDSVFIPEFVKELGEGWCSCNKQLVDVVISPKNPNFKYLDNEHQIIVRKSDQNINSFDTIAFACRDVKQFEIPKSIRYIDSYAFENCKKLSILNFSKNSQLLAIGKHAFIFCNFEQITIPSSVFQIRKCSFQYCEKLKSIKFEKGSKICSFETSLLSFCYNLNQIEISDDSNILFIERNVFCNDKIERLYIPASVEELKEGWCFDLLKLKEVIISPKNKHFKYLDEKHQVIVRKSDPNKEIYDSIVFASRDITTITIPKTIKYIESYSFENCEQLEEIIFHKDSQLQTIGENAFFRSSIQEFILPKNVKKIGKKALFECHKLQKFEIEKGSKLKSLPELLFSYSQSLKTIIIPEISSIQRIEAEAFRETLLESLFIPETVQELEEGWCKSTINLKEVKVSPRNKYFKYLDKNHQIIIRGSDPNKENFDTIAFACRGIECATIPKTIKYIDSYAFENCERLKCIKIPEDSEMKSFPIDLFRCSSLESFSILPSIQKSKVNKNYKYLDEHNEIIVKKSNPNSSEFDTVFFANRSIEYAFIPKSIKFIESTAFYRCKCLECVEFSEDSELQRISKFAFYSSTIQSIKIPKSVCEIGVDAFFQCYQLQEVIIEEGSKLEEISANLFYECNDLTIIHLPEDCSLKKISSAPFCETLIEILFIPANVEELEEGWCYSTPELKEVVISSKNKHFKYLNQDHQIIVKKSDLNAENFDTIVFANRNIKTAIIPKTIKYIKSCAFENCQQLEFLDIPEDSQLENIGEDALSYSSIKSFIIPKNMKKIGKIFLYCSCLESLEFQGDLLNDDLYFLGHCFNLRIISFPNVQKLKICDLNIFDSDFRLFIQAGSKFELSSSF